MKWVMGMHNKSLHIQIRKLNHPDTMKFRQMYRLSNRGPLIQKMKIKNSCANHLAKSFANFLF